MNLIKNSLIRPSQSLFRWKEVLFDSGQKGVKPYDLKAFKDFFDPYLEQYFSLKRKDLSNISQNEIIADVLKRAEFLVTVGGKRVRPYMLYLAFLSSGGKINDEVYKFGLAIEFLHFFALIHDDIIDHSDVRHGQSTIHTYLKSSLADYPRGNKEHIGQSLAILVGDVIFNWSYSLITEAGKEKATKIYRQMIDEVIVGQMIDVTLALAYEVSLETILEKNDLKTSRYSFVNPMLIGQALAGRQDKTLFYEKFGSLLGQAFQIQDDVLDVIGDSKKTGKDNFTDVAEGQHTVLSQHILTGEDSRARDLLLSLFGRELKERDKEVLRRLFIDSGAIESAKDKIKNLLEEAKKSLESENFPSLIYEAWMNFIIKMENRSA